MYKSVTFSLQQLCGFSWSIKGFMAANLKSHVCGQKQKSTFADVAPPRLLLLLLTFCWQRKCYFISIWLHLKNTRRRRNCPDYIFLYLYRVLRSFWIYCILLINTTSQNTLPGNSSPCRNLHSLTSSSLSTFTSFFYTVETIHSIAIYNDFHAQVISVGKDKSRSETTFVLEELSL